MLWLKVQTCSSSSQLQSSKYAKKSSLCWTPTSPKTQALISPRIIEFFPYDPFLRICRDHSGLVRWLSLYVWMEDIKEWCGLRSFVVLHLWAPRHSDYLTDLHSSWYKVQRGKIACRKINTALLGESVSNNPRGTALVQCRVQEIESSPMLTLEIAECLIHILGVGAPLTELRPNDQG